MEDRLSDIEIRLKCMNTLITMTIKQVESSPKEAHMRIIEDVCTIMETLTDDALIAVDEASGIAVKNLMGEQGQEGEKRMKAAEQAIA